MVMLNHLMLNETILQIKKKNTFNYVIAIIKKKKEARFNQYKNLRWPSNKIPYEIIYSTYPTEGQYLFHINLSNDNQLYVFIFDIAINLTDKQAIETVFGEALSKFTEAHFL